MSCLSFWSHLWSVQREYFTSLLSKDARWTKNLSDGKKSNQHQNDWKIYVVRMENIWKVGNESGLEYEEICKRTLRLYFLFDKMTSWRQEIREVNYKLSSYTFPLLLRVPTTAERIWTSFQKFLHPAFLEALWISLDNGISFRSSHKTNI